jgi:hypothetical protein
LEQDDDNDDDEMVRGVEKGVEREWWNTSVVGEPNLLGRARISIPRGPNDGLSGVEWMDVWMFACMMYFCLAFSLSEFVGCLDVWTGIFKIQDDMLRVL